MKLSEKIQSGYAHIGQQIDNTDRVKAYMDFVGFVQEQKPTLEEMAEASLQGSRALDAIDAGFAQEIHEEPESAKQGIEGTSDRMLARTGTLIVANMSHILAVRGYARTESKPDEYIGLINVARAALCYPVSAQQGDADMEYADVIDEHVQNLELSQQIAFAAAPAPNGEIYTVGAAGIRPSEFALQHLDASLDGFITTDQAIQLSGFFGRMAAVSALSHLIDERLDKERLSAQSLSQNIHSLINAEINVG